MSDFVFATITDRAFLMALLVAVAVFATFYSLMPSFGGSSLKARMKTVALEREELRARQRSRLASDAERRKGAGSLRITDRSKVKGIVETLDLRRALVDQNTVNAMRVAGFRSQTALSTFLFFRLLMPLVCVALMALYIFAADGFSEQPLLIQVCICVMAAGLGFYLPVIYVTNCANKRKLSISRAWPDALDLMLICVESGMSIEAAFKKVSEEIGSQSADLAEELVLTNAELSFLSERKQAFDNLAARTGVESVKSVSQALLQAERYGTPIAHALRVLAAESRDQRMNAAEKKAAALPPKLTVPMILFFLPVLFAVILGPAGMTIAANGGVGPGN